MAKTLVVIEAPGKILQLSRVLRQLGLRDIEVVATVGHVAGNPESLRDLCISDGYTETAYRLQTSKEALALSIAESAAAAARVYLATDDDQEGDVIARDVWRYCLREEDQVKALRVRLRAITPGEVRVALAAASAVDPNTAAKGDARRVIDRLIGSLSTRNAVVGRVHGSLLIALLNERLVRGVVTHVMTADDGHGEWLCREPVLAGAKPPVPLRLDASVRRGEFAKRSLAIAPMGYEALVLNASLRTGASPREVASATQELYERGRLTYPRSRSSLVSAESARRLGLLARSVGAGFRDELFRAAVRPAEDARSHEAPNPVDLDVPVNRALEFLPLQDQVLVCAARNLIACGIDAVIEKPLPSAVPPEAIGRDWSRTRALGAVLWEQPKAAAQVHWWTPEQSVFQFLAQREMGRPSTIVDHAVKFLSRELCSDELRLNERGQAWARANGELLGRGNVARRIEELIESSNGTAQEIAVEVVAECGLHAVESLVRSHGASDVVESLEVSAGQFH